MITLSKSLRREGVRFHDLRMIFEDVAEPLYIDNCCHLNDEGYERIARRIAHTIMADLTNQASVETRSETR